MKRLLWLAALGLSMAVVLTLAGGCEKTRELSAEEARELLMEVREARRSVVLKGQVTTKVRLAELQVDADATVHRGEGRFQLEFISGDVEGVRIIEQQGGVWQIAADGEAVRHLPRNPVDEVPFMGRGAVVQIGSGGRMAGRPTDKVIIRPHPDVTARIEMWLDRDTRFPLGVDRYNNEDVLIAGTRYVSVDFSVSPPVVAELPEEAQRVAERPIGERIEKTRATEVLEREPLEPTDLPDGFAFQGYFLHQRGRGQAVELRYSDGVRLVSVLQFRLGRLGEGRRPTEAMGEPRERRPGDDDAERPRRMRDDSTDPDAVREPREWPRGDEPGERPRRMRPDRPDPDAGYQPRGERPVEARPDGLPGRPDFRDRVGEGGPPEGPGMAGRDPDGAMMRSVLRGRIVRFRADGLYVVVAGEISEEQLNRVADSMRPVSTGF